MEQKHHLTNRDDVFLCIPPLYHTGAKFHWMGSLCAGSKAVLIERNHTGDHSSMPYRKEHCTIVWLLVPWAQDILDSLDRGDLKLEDYELSQWRLMHIGAQPVPPSLIQTLEGIFPEPSSMIQTMDCQSLQVQVVYILVLKILIKLVQLAFQVTAGPARLSMRMEMHVHREKSESFVSQGPGVMTCYYNDPKATAETIKDGWLYTGDMAMQDEDGFYFLVDRKKDVIVSGGENIYPVQIEKFLKCL